MFRRMRFPLILVLLAGFLTAGYLTRKSWQERLFPKAGETADRSQPVAPPGKIEVLELSPEARKNLGLIVKPIKLQNYWKTVQLPGAVVDRPGKSDRGVTSPAVAVVAMVHAYPGDTVHPGDRLFTLRVFSEYLQNTQSELFKATKELQLIAEQKERIRKAAEEGAIPASRMIELESQNRRQMTAIQGYRQDLLTRGFLPEQIDKAATGEFVSTIDVVAPPPVSDEVPVTEKQTPESQPTDPSENHLAYEVEKLTVELGQQVQAGEVLCYLANHQELYIRGHAFKQEAPLLERVAQNNWPAEVQFAEDDASGWPSLDQTFQIHHLANSIDPVTRTFDFFIPLKNQSRGFQKDGRTFIAWRFRPGQRVRLRIPVEELKEVFVLPSAGVVREGPEAYVFRQNGDLFNRKPVHVLYEDRLNIVVANDGQITPGLFIAQNGAASLNRVLKAQAASGVPAGIHVHADGTTHGAH